MTRRRRSLLLGAAVLVAVLALGLVLRSRGSSPEPAPPPLPPIDVAVAPALVQPPGGEIAYGLAESGQVLAVLVREGELVRRGDPLVQLEAGIQLEALRIARAELTVAGARLAELRSGVRPEEVSAARAEYASALARSRRARENFQRIQRLVRSGAATTAALDEARRDYESQRAAARAAGQRADAAAAGPTIPQLAVAEAEVEAARARLSQAEEQLARRTARAPVDAHVLSVEVEPGELYSPMSPVGTRALLVLGPAGPLEVLAEIDELFAQRVKLGAAAEILGESNGRPLATGRVVELKPLMGVKSLVSDRASEQLDRRVREALIALDVDEALVPGQRVRVRVRLEPEDAPRPEGTVRARRSGPRR